MPAQPIVHIEIPAKDRAVTGEFYQKMFGWQIEDMPDMKYTSFISQPGLGGGFPDLDPKMYQPGEVVVYIGVDDIDQKLDEIAASGGKILVPKTEIPTFGWFAFFADPTGNRLGLYTAMVTRNSV